MRTVITTLVFFLIPIAGLAHGTPFFEFNPDSYVTSALNVASFQTPAETFIPQNDFLNGFDFWLDNPGNSGPVLFQLLDENSTIISSKTITIPTINVTPGGTRFHVDLSGQLPVINNKKYTIKIISSIPALKLYYNDRIKFLLHNAPYVSEYLQGVALLGSEVQDFSFKFALYEGQETKLPIITNVSAVTITSGQVKISFNASEPVDYKITYKIQGQNVSQTTNFTGGYKFCSEGVSVCDLIIDVSPNQTYDYTLTARDIWGNQIQFVGVFASFSSFQATQTPAPVSTSPSILKPSGLKGSPQATLTATPLTDTIPPKILNLKVVNLTANSADFTWDTDEAANSFLLISYSVNFITITAANDTTFELSHLLKTGQTINPNTIYFATITSRDLADNTTSATLSFTTPKLSANVTPTTLPSTSLVPIISSSPVPSISGQPLSSPLNQNPAITSNVETLPPLNVSSTENSNSISIAWNPPAGGEPADGYRIDVFNQKGTPEHKILASPGTHKTIIDNVVDGIHNIIVYANNNGVNEKIAKPVQVVTPQKSSLEKTAMTLPYILGGLVVLILIGAVLLKFFKKKPDQNLPTPPPSITFR